MTISGPRRVYFSHIPKTGGVSIESMLSRGGGLVACPAYRWDELFEIGDLSEFSLFQGHLHYFCKYFIGDSFDFTILRDPVERSVSAFQHIYQRPRHRDHRFIKEAPDLASALDHPVLQRHVSNVQSLFLGLRPKFNGFQCRKAAMQEACRSYDDREVLAEAKKVILEMSFVGFTESLDSDQFKLMKMIYPDSSVSSDGAALNRNPRKSSATWREILPSEVLDKVISRNRLDYELYEFALEVAESRGWR